MELEIYRSQIDAIDEEILAKLEERFSISAKIGEYKKTNNLSVLDAEREWEKLEAIENASKPELAEYNLDVFEAIIAASRSLQEDGE
ncbi:MAG: chorismate mutase [Firmicutes bacterium]|nr:chorismate mutase [Bacillota bacterium]